MSKVSIGLLLYKNQRNNDKRDENAWASGRSPSRLNAHADLWCHMTMLMYFGHSCTISRKYVSRQTHRRTRRQDLFYTLCHWHGREKIDKWKTRLAMTECKGYVKTKYSLSQKALREQTMSNFASSFFALGILNWEKIPKWSNQSEKVIKSKCSSNQFPSVRKRI